jgi:hypothetical protein
MVAPPMTASFRCVAYTMWCFLLPPVLVVGRAEPPTAQQLRQELQQLRTEYETRLRQIEQQLEQLEAKAQPAPRPVTAPEADSSSLAPATTNPPRLPVLPSDRESARRQFLTEQFQPTTESRDMAREQDREQLLRDRLEKVLSEFVDFSGYFRAGYGRNSEGGIQVPFKAPGAGSKYRLGNETENYGELALGKSFFVPGLFSTTAPSGAGAAEDPADWGPVARFQFRLAFSNPYSGGTDFSVPEAWASLGNLLGSQPEMKFWAGNRFYRRHDIHVTDFYFYNMSGKGAGVEDFDVGFAKMALAWIGESSQDATYGDVILPDPANKSGFAKSNWDLRLYDLAAPLGKVEIGVTLANSEGGRDEDGAQVDDALGVGLNVVHTAEGLRGRPQCQQAVAADRQRTRPHFFIGVRSLSFQGIALHPSRTPGIMASPAHRALHSAALRMVLDRTRADLRIHRFWRARRFRRHSPLVFGRRPSGDSIYPELWHRRGRWPRLDHHRRARRQRAG